MKLIDDLKSTNVTLPADKPALVYVLLAFFLGAYGVHNLWAGNSDKGKAQLIIGFCCCAPLIYITALLDVANLIENLRKKA
jgi:hypothetical protein